MSQSTCGWCGIRTSSPNGVCANCQSIEANADRGYTYEHGLYGGQWVNRNGIQVWQSRTRRPAVKRSSYVVLPKSTLIEAAADIVKAVA